VSTNRLYEKLITKNEIAVGLGTMYPAPGIIEGMCAGWDFAWIDCQHGQYTHDRTLEAVRAAEAVGVSSLMRVPTHDPGWLGVYADTGPSAIMVPMVNTAEEARSIVQALAFPPLGTRSYGARRLVDLDGRTYFQDRKLMITVQIETPEAIENAEQIAGTEGVDVVFFGGDDVKTQMGVPINTPPLNEPRLVQGLERTAAAAAAAGCIAGAVSPTPETFTGYLAMGYRLLVCGGDSGFMRAGAAAALAWTQAGLAEAGR